MKKILGAIFVLTVIFTAVFSLSVHAAAVDVTVTANEGWASATYDSSTMILANVSDGYSFKLANLNGTALTAALQPNGVQTASKIVIPSAVLYNGKNYNITAIYEYILGRPNPNVQEVIVSEGITKLGTGATSYAQTFRDATGLQHVTLPSTLTYISGNAFMSCTSLQSVDIPEAVTIIDKQAFSGAAILANITFNGANLTTIGDSCFVN